MTVLYSPYPAVYDDPAELRAIYSSCLLDDREAYPALPWTMEEIVGTVWRCVHTGDRLQITRLAPSKYFKSGDVLEVWGNHELFNYETSLGLWITRANDAGQWVPHRYIIEHWARADHLSGSVVWEWNLIFWAEQRKMGRRDNASIPRHDKHQLTLF